MGYQKKLLNGMGLAAIMFTWQAMAAEISQNLKPKVSVETAGDHQSVRVKINLPEGLKFNMDGPWALDVAGEIDFVDGNKINLVKKDWHQEGREGYFLLRAKDAQANRSSSYKIAYFYCAEDFSWCKRGKDTGDIKL